MKTYIIAPLAVVLISLLSGCTTERHYDTPPQTVIYQDKQSAGETRSDAREAAREGAREGARDSYR